MDEKDILIRALELELQDTLNDKLALRQQVLVYENRLKEQQEEDKGE